MTPDDRALIERLDVLVSDEREDLAEILSCIASVESKGLHGPSGYADMFDYCVRRLKYGEGAAIQRLYTSRAAAKYPQILSMIRDGSLSLGTASRLSHHLTPGNVDRALTSAAGKSKREVELLILELAQEAREREAPTAPAASGSDASLPLPAADDVVIRPVAPATRTVIKLVSPGLHRLAFMVDDKFLATFERAKAFMPWDARAKTTGGQLQHVLEDYLRRRDPALRPPLKEKPPRKSRVRRVPAWVRQKVWERDASRCAFMAADGTRCAATLGLELDHVIPWALGGSSDDPDNIRLLCRAHNLHLARETFGDRPPLPHFSLQLADNDI